MADITIAELAAQIPETDPVRDWWEGADAMPADTDVNEFLLKTLKAASDAARAKNANLTAGSRINAYPDPVNSTVVTDTSTGTQSFITTYSVRGRVAVNLDVVVPPLA